MGLTELRVRGERAPRPRVYGAPVVADGFRIQVIEDGPYRVSGGVPLVRTAQVETEFGEPVAWEPDEPVAAATEDYDLCRCGNTSRPPFCDATHERVPFDGTEVADRVGDVARVRGNQHGSTGGWPAGLRDRRRVQPVRSGHG